MAMDIGTLVGYLELDTQKWEGPLGDVGKKMPGWMAAAGAGAALAVAAAFSASFVNAVNIEAGNDKIAGQLGLTEEESERAGQAAAGAYGNAFGESLEAVQAATGGVISSIKGMREASVDELQGITEKVLTLSDGFEIEADRISQVVGQMLTTGMASSAEEGLDLLTAALQKVPAAVREDILDATDEYGPFFAQIGMSGEAAMSALVAASEKGMFGIDKTGDAVKEFSIRGTDMSKASIAAYEAMGLSAEEMTDKLLAGGERGKEAFTQVVDGLRGIENPADQAAAAIALFGTPLEDIGTSEIPAFLDGLSNAAGGLGDVEGAAQSMADSMGDNVATKWAEVQRSFEMVVNTVMSDLLPAIMPLLDWAAQNPELLGAVAAAIGIVAAAFGVLAAAQWAVNAAMFASPITWIILAVVALVAAVVALALNWDTVVAWLTETWNGFVSWFTEVMDGFLAWWDEVWAGFGSWVTEVWNGFISWIQETWNGFVSWLQEVGNGLAEWWNGLWAGIGQWVQDVWNGLVSWVTGIFVSMAIWLMQTGAGIVSWWNGLWSGIGAFFTSVWQGIVSWVTGLVDSWLNGWRSIFSALIGFFSGIWSSITSGITSAWTGAVSWLQGVPGMIMGVFSGIGTWLLDSGRALIQGFIDGISGMIGAVGDAIGGVLDFVGGFFPHSPAKWGPFSGSGWTAVLDGGASLMEQFADGMHGVDPFSDARIQAALAGDWGSSAPAPVEHVPTGGDTFIYNAAENQSLDSEEALFAALGSPRSPFGGME